MPNFKISRVRLFPIPPGLVLSSEIEWRDTSIQLNVIYEAPLLTFELYLSIHMDREGSIIVISLYKITRILHLNNGMPIPIPIPRLCIALHMHMHYYDMNT